MPVKTPPQSRRARLWRSAQAQGIPLRAILVTVAVVVVTFMAGKLLYLSLIHISEPTRRS